MDSPTKEGKPLVSEFHEASSYYGVSVTELTDLNEVWQSVSAHLTQCHKWYTCVTYLLQNKDREKLEALGGIQGLANALSTSTSDGITLSPQGDLSLEHRQRVFGANAFKEVQQKAFLTLLLGNLKDPTLILLMVAALVIHQCCRNHLS